MRYRFHPLVGERLAVVRLHYVNDEPCYVIRRSNGTTVAVPAWMTELAAANVRVVEQPRLSIAANKRNLSDHMCCEQFLLRANIPCRRLGSTRRCA
ncbi:hypothetical protein KNO81_23560 [Paraburkholderia sediminicola]|nr:hypothetical protein [Paraburkholderia sediminicola]